MVTFADLKTLRLHFTAIIPNKTGTSQVGSIPKAQKEQTFENMLRTIYMNNSQQSFETLWKNPNDRTGAPGVWRAKKGTIWDFSNILPVAKYQKNCRGTLGELKDFRKKNGK